MCGQVSDFFGVFIFVSVLGCITFLLLLLWPFVCALLCLYSKDTLVVILLLDESGNWRGGGVCVCVFAGMFACVCAPVRMRVLACVCACTRAR